MRLRIWGRLAAAAVGAAALAGSVSAQTPAPVVVPHQVVAQPAPGPTSPTVAAPGALPSIPVAAQPAPVVVQPAPAAVPPAAVAPVAPAPGPAVVAGNGGCSNCGPGGTAHRGFVMNATGGYVGTACGYGHPCNNGCGSLRSDLGVVFGSCRSFFSPCGPGLHGVGKHGRGDCNIPVFGSGPCGPFNPCIYDSYLNH